MIRHSPLNRISEKQRAKRGGGVVFSSFAGAGEWKRHAINRISKRKREDVRERAALRKELQRERGRACELKFHPQCRGVEEGLHHRLKVKHGGANTRANCLLACNLCNVHVENEPDAAYALGFTVKSWEANQTTEEQR